MAVVLRRVSGHAAPSVAGLNLILRNRIMSAGAAADLMARR